MIKNIKKQIELLKIAKEHMPQGVAENYRYWGENATIFVDHVEGCNIIDCDGNKYVDFRLGYGPIILGYRDKRVDEFVYNTISTKGTLTGFSTSLDIKVVEKIKKMCPNVDLVRFANSGTEAVIGAIRTARGYTKRDRIVIFEGSFHGLNDEVMWKSDLENWDDKENAEPEIIPFGNGVTRNSKNLVELLSLNDSKGLESLFEKKGNELACVILEPIIGNAGSISATREWLKKLRDLCTYNNTLLIFDEVKSGFRVSKGGAQELYGISGDLSVYAKAMGNGYPVACFGGRKDIMSKVGSFKGGVIHGGTYTGNLISLSGALATLEILDETDAYQTINKRGNEILHILGRVFTKYGIDHSFAGPPAMFGIHFTSNLPNNYRDWKKTNSALYTKFAWNLINNGVLLEPDSREPWFICEAHKNVDLSWLEDVCSRSMDSAIKETSELI